MKHISKKSGTTLVEMIVCFALLGMFIVAVVGCVPALLKTYFRIQNINQMQSVADAIIQSIRAEVQSAHGTSSDDSGDYIKLRSSSGDTVLLDTENGMTGVSLEFICAARTENASAGGASEGEMEILLFAEQIDCQGLSALQDFADAPTAIQYHKNNGEPDPSNINYTLIPAESMPKGYPVQRYYTCNSSDQYQDVFMDQPQFYDAQLIYAKAGLMGCTASLTYEIPKQAITVSEGVAYVHYLKLTVTLENTSGRTYMASTAIDLVNLPVYQSAPSMVSDF